MNPMPKKEREEDLCQCFTPQDKLNGENLIVCDRCKKQIGFKTWNTCHDDLTKWYGERLSKLASFLIDNRKIWTLKEWGQIRMKWFTLEEKFRDYLTKEQAMEKEIVKYEVSKDSMGLLAYFEDGGFYHIHSDELTKLEDWILELLHKVG